MVLLKLSRTSFRIHSFLDHITLRKPTAKTWWNSQPNIQLQIFKYDKTKKGNFGTWRRTDKIWLQVNVTSPLACCGRPAQNTCLPSLLSVIAWTLEIMWPLVIKRQGILDHQSMTSPWQRDSHTCCRSKLWCCHRAGRWRQRDAAVQFYAGAGWQTPRCLVLFHLCVV